MNTLTLDYIRTATTVATFLISQQLAATASNIRNYFRGHSEPLAPLFEQPEEVAFVGKLVIDRELLRGLTADVSESVKAYMDCLHHSRTPQERDGCDRRAERRVCETLNRIRARNQGQLPTDYLRHQWESYGCVLY